MLKSGPLIKKNMAKEVENLDHEIHSRYEKIHGPDGLCSTLIESFYAMVEPRMKAEYGDYLAYTCYVLKGEGMSDMVWKVNKLDWQEVAKRIIKEEETSAVQRRRALAPSPTPYLDDV